MRVNSIFHLYTNMNFTFSQYISIGSSFLLPAYGKGGARATTIIPPPEKFCPSAKQAGKKGGGLGEGIFARQLCPAKRDWGWEAARPCVSKEAKPAKIETSFKGRAQKVFSNKESIFAGFACRRQAASRWAGLPPCGRQLVSVGVLLVEGSNFFQQTPPKFIRQGMRLAPAALGAHFIQIIPRFFEGNRQRARRKAAVHKQSLFCGRTAKNRWFSFAFGESQNEISKLSVSARRLYQ